MGESNATWNPDWFTVMRLRELPREPPLESDQLEDLHRLLTHVNAVRSQRGLPPWGPSSDVSRVISMLTIEEALLLKELMEREILTLALRKPGAP